MAPPAKRTRKWRAPKGRTTSRKKRASRAPRTASGRGGRAMWKGVLTFASVKVPVKLYSGISDKSIHFRLLDAKKHQPVKQHMIDPETGEIVENVVVKNAYETKSGELVMLDDDELEAAQPEASRDIEITRFVDQDEVNPSWYDRPYFLAPDSEGEKNYFALARALGEQKKEGIARWVMRNTEYVGALKAEGDYLALITLRHAGEVVPASALPAPGGRDVSQKEVAMAKQLVDTMIGEFDPAKYKDEYRARVLDLVEAKAKGKVIKFPKAPRRTETQDLTSVLQKSLATAKRRKSA